VKYIILLILPMTELFALDLDTFLTKELEIAKVFSKTNLKYLKAGKNIIKTEVTSPKKSFQKISEKILLFHKKQCSSVISTIGQYENYTNFFDFVNKSEYKNNHIYLKIKFFLIPREFPINVKINRLSTPKEYPFVFNTGFLDGLQGILNIKEVNNRCLIHFSMDWEGKYTGMSNYILETFLYTIAKYGMRKMLLITGHGRTY